MPVTHLSNEAYAMRALRRRIESLAQASMIDGQSFGGFAVPLQQRGVRNLLALQAEYFLEREIIDDQVPQITASLDPIDKFLRPGVTSKVWTIGWVRKRDVD